MDTRDQDHAKTVGCDHPWLMRSLDERLSEPEEELLAQHLTECKACRQKLESLASDPNGWSQIGVVLRKESSGEHANGKRNEDEIYEGSTWKPSDFIVDFLQPSISSESLGRIGNIEIREFIGQGAHGIVLKGFQEELNRLVAVKVMAPHLASVVAARKRFAREARATAAIVHPNVLPILHVDSTGQLPYLVMPYVDCESLQDRLDREGPLSISDALRIGLQVARGLAAAHAQGLVHRDVKPANILLERGVERVMLTDFGLARAVDDATLTRSGFIAGTPHYMSPEQALGNAVDTRSDLFSLGSVLYATCTGRPPFRAESTFGILRRVTDDSPRPLHELNPDVPIWLEGIVLKLLSKPVRERFETAEYLGTLLEACLAHVQQPGTIPLPMAAKKLGSLMPRGSRASPLKAIVATVGSLGALIAICALLVSVPRWSKTPEEEKNASRSEATANIQPTRPLENTILLLWNDGIASELQTLESILNVLDEATATP